MPGEELLDDLDAILNKPRGGPRKSVSDEVDAIMGDGKRTAKTAEAIRPERKAERLCVETYRWPRMTVHGTKVIILVLQVDDSGSMDGFGRDTALRDAIRNMDNDLNYADKEIILIVIGYSQTYYAGNLRDADFEDIAESIEFDNLTTPHVATALKVAESVAELEKEFNGKGIATVVNMLLATDGLPTEDGYPPEAFDEYVIKRKRHWKFFGLGITRDIEDLIEEDKANFTKHFRRMGVKNNISATPDQLKAVFSGFSRSVIKL